MECESDCGEAVEAKTSVSDNKHVKFSPRVKVFNTQGGGCGPLLETTLKENESGSARSLDSSDTVSSSSSCDDIAQVNPHMILESIGEDSIPQPTACSNRLEESAKECPESTSQQADANHTCFVEHMLPTLSPSIQVMECREGCNSNSSASTEMEGDAAPDDSLFSINIGDTSFSTDDAISMAADLNNSVELPKLEQSFRSGELCQSGESPKFRELCQSGEAYEPALIPTCGFSPSRKERDCQSIEHLMANDSCRPGELARFHQTSPTTKVVEPIKNLDVAKTMTMTMSVKQGEKEMVGKPINDVPKALMNNQVNTNIEDSRGTSSKPQSERTVVLPKKKKSLFKFCHCFKWPSCSSKLSGFTCKCIRWPGCSFKWFVWPCCSRNCLNWQGCCCKRPSNQFKCPSWPCLKRRC